MKTIFFYEHQNKYAKTTQIPEKLQKTILKKSKTINFKREIQQWIKTLTKYHMKAIPRKTGSVVQTKSAPI